MNRIVSAVVMCFLAIAAAAQEKAEIEVSYVAISPNMKNGKDIVKIQYILLANSTESKFYSPMTEYLDSLNSTPEGVAKYQEMTRNAYFGGKMNEMPRKDGSYYVLKFYQQKSLARMIPQVWINSHTTSLLRSGTGK